MYLICYPQGGWNDMLSRIWYCYQYCSAVGRILIIDTRKNWFRDDLSPYLSFSFPFFYKTYPSEWITHLYQTGTVFPPQLQGMNNDEFPTIVWKGAGHMETTTGIIVSTRLNRDYSETVVVYADCGAILHLNPVLTWTTFSPWVVSEVERRFRSLPPDTISVHIRNTDYKSNVDDFLLTHHDVFSASPLFVATDHAPTLQRMRQLYQVYSFSYVPHVEEGANIHESHQGQMYRTSHEETQSFNLDLICDFLLLALGKYYYYSHGQSGFSRSVLHLRKDQRLLKQLLPFTVICPT